MRRAALRADDTLAKISSETSGCRLAGGQELVEGDRQVSYPDAGGVVRGVGDRGGGTHDADLADALGTHRVDVWIVLVHPERFDRADVGVGGDVVLGEVVVDHVPVPRRTAPRSCASRTAGCTGCRASRR